MPTELSKTKNDFIADNFTSSELWNPDVALRRMGHDSTLLCTLVDYFLEDSPVLLQQLHDLIHIGDAEESSRLAHNLKGLCANFEARAAINVAADTENACRNGNFPDAIPLFKLLNEEIRKLVPSLTSWQSRHPR